MYIRLLTLLLSTALPLMVASAWGDTIIQTIHVQGNSVFSSREVLSWFSSRPSLLYSEAILAKDLSVIIEKYQERGYLTARIDSVSHELSPDSSLVELTVTLYEGTQTVVGAIRFEGQNVLSQEEILVNFDIRSGEPLNEAVLERDIDDLLRRYERLGYPFTRCRIASIDETADEQRQTIELTLGIEEGQRVTIDEISVEGNKDTDASVVVRETRLLPGEVYNPDKVGAIRQRLKRLNIFSNVSEPELYLRGDKGGLLIKVQEGNTNTFDGILGYVPGGTTGQSGFLTGLASITMRNLFGTGRKMSFRWQREDRFSQELAVRYLEPWIFNEPVNIGVAFLQRQQDTAYVRRSFDLRGELMLSEEFSATLLFGNESVVPSAGIGGNRVSRSSTISAGGELVYDTRDDIYSPTAGARYSTDYRLGRKNISGSSLAAASSSVAVQRFSLDLDLYLSTFSRQVLAIGFHGRELRSGDADEGEMFRFGGTNSLRGYRENQFVGSRVAWSNVEYRFLLARRSFLYGFVDTGYYFRPADGQRLIQQVDAFKYGYGIGIQLETALGNLGVSFALGQEDSFSTGKVHFGLINEF